MRVHEAPTLGIKETTGAIKVRLAGVEVYSLPGERLFRVCKPGEAEVWFPARTHGLDPVPLRRVEIVDKE